MLKSNAAFPCEVGSAVNKFAYRSTLRCVCKHTTAQCVDPTRISNMTKELDDHINVLKCIIFYPFEIHVSYTATSFQ
jgi:hypothetical protein